MLTLAAHEIEKSKNYQKNMNAKSSKNYQYLSKQSIRRITATATLDTDIYTSEIDNYWLADINRSYNWLLEKYDKNVTECCICFNKFPKNETISCQNKQNLGINLTAGSLFDLVAVRLPESLGTDSFQPKKKKESSKTINFPNQETFDQMSLKRTNSVLSAESLNSDFEIIDHPSTSDYVLLTDSDSNFSFEQNFSELDFPKQISRKKAESHHFCKSCLNKYLKFQFLQQHSNNEGHLVTLSRSIFCQTYHLDIDTSLPLCPNCDNSLLDLTTFQDKNYVKNSKIFEAYNLLLTKNLVYSSVCNQMIADMPTKSSSNKNTFRMVKCPQESCRSVIDISDTCCHEIICPYCQYQFCYNCFTSWHTGQSCIDFVKSQKWYQRIGDLIIKCETATTSELSNSNDNLPSIGASSLKVVDQIVDNLDKLTLHFSKNLLTKQKLVQLVQEDSNNLDTFQHMGQKEDLILDIQKINQILTIHQEKLTLSLIQDTCMACPNCFIPIERNEGCQIMMCLNCKLEFNYGKYTAEEQAEIDQGIFGLHYNYHQTKNMKKGLVPKFIKVKEHLELNVNKKNGRVGQGLNGMTRSRRTLPSERRAKRTKQKSAFPGYFRRHDTMNVRNGNVSETYVCLRKYSNKKFINQLPRNEREHYLKSLKDKKAADCKRNGKQLLRYGVDTNDHTNYWYYKRQTNTQPNRYMKNSRFMYSDRRCYFRGTKNKQITYTYFYRHVQKYDGKNKVWYYVTYQDFNWSRGYEEKVILPTKWRS